MSDNPFNYGKPISDADRFFGRKYEVEHIYSRLRNREFESSSIVGERRIGKTSLLYYLSDPGVRRKYGLDGKQYIFVYVDLQMVTETMTPTQLWKRLLQKLEKKCRNAEIVGMIGDVRRLETIDNFALDELFTSIDGEQHYVVFLMDEFEMVTQNKNFGPDFYYLLRSLAIHHNLALVTSSCDELIKLCHSSNVRSSPFFNIFSNINLRLFNEAEAHELISTYLTGTNVLFDDKEKEVVFQLAGYHPNFLQTACYFLYESYNQHLPPAERIEFMKTRYCEEANSHVRDFWDHSDDNVKIVLSIQALLEHREKVVRRTFKLKTLQDYQARSGGTLIELKKRGLLISSGDQYNLASSFLTDWIIREVTDLSNDGQTYQDWLKTNPGLIERISTEAQQEISTILPKIAGRYREMIIDWASDPKNLIVLTGILRDVFQS